MNADTITQFIKDLGATHCQFISPELLIPEERIWRYCRENRCGCYGKHLMCPPNTGTISEITDKFRRFKTGILIQYTAKLDVKRDSAGVTASKLKLHHIILETETHLKAIPGIAKVFGMIGGECGLCEECAGHKTETCVQPEKARTSLEALGVDVIALLERLSLDGRFHDDQVTWTAMVLIDHLP
jgi:predicted metal-binding protein